MKQNCSVVAFPFILAIIIAGCAGSKQGSAEKREDVNMSIKEKPDVIQYASLKKTGRT